VFAQRLDRTKPLWEMWVVEGLADGRWALLSKTHHSLVDGVSGVDLATVLFDLDREPRRPPPDDPWQPRPEPTPADLAAASVRSGVGRLVGMPFHAIATAARPGQTIGEVRTALEGLGEVAWAGLNPPPDTPLNVRIGPHRRFDVVTATLADFKTVKNAFGATVNDVLLAVVAGALSKFFHSRGLRTEGLELRVCVPVSIRTDEEHGALGNRLTQVVAPLPVYIQDPLARLRAVMREMGDVKDSKQALGAQVIAGFQDFAPPTILAQASRMNFSTRFFNLLVTNIPGPQIPLYVLGRELQAIHPVPFLAGDRALAVAVMSYNGCVGFGLLADLDALPDLDVIAEGIAESLAELVALAEGETPEGLGLKPKPRKRPAKRAGGTATKTAAKPKAAAKPKTASKRKPAGNTNGGGPAKR
jgi:WS/DGAT/MGAT family acyltransferase